MKMKIKHKKNIILFLEAPIKQQIKENNMKSNMMFNMKKKKKKKSLPY